MKSANGVGMVVLIATALAVVFGPVSPTVADDTPIEIATGGLQFKKVPEVTMDREDLTISRNKVQVSYIFTNQSDKAITTDVEFPIPPYEWTVTMSSSEQPAFLDFYVESDGKKIEPRTDLHALLDGKDVTDVLKRKSIPLLDINKGYRVLQKLNPKDRQDLIALKLVQDQGGEYWPNWVMNVNFYWKQSFPAHQSVHITHTYTPHTGGRLECSTSHDGMTDACLGPGDQPQITKMIASLSPKECAFLTRVKFILKTANNWGGPIKDFHLRIKKRPDEFVGMCGWNFQSKTTMSWDTELKNFTPSDDITVYFISPPFHKSQPTNGGSY